MFFSKSSILTVCFFVFVFLFFSQPISSFAQTSDLVIQNYQLVSKTRVGRTAYDYVFKANIKNNGTKDAVNATASLTSLVATTTVIDNSLTFGIVPAGATVTSSDTFTVRINLAYSFNASNLQWAVNAEFPEAYKVIGPAGGTVEVTDSNSPIYNASVEIPDGALAEETVITINRTGKYGEVSAVHQFGPSGLQFQVPVKVSISYNPLLLPENIKEDFLYLVAEAEDGDFEALKTVDVDKVNHVITGQTLHFSSILIIYDSLVVNQNNQPITTTYIESASDIRLPVGDSWNLTNKKNEVTCGYLGLDRPLSYKDFGDSLDLLEISPKSFNKNVAELYDRWSVKGEFINSQERYNAEERYHTGEDWNNDLGGNNDEGMPIHAIADGVVLLNLKLWSEDSIKSDKTYSYGNIVVIGHKLNNETIIVSVYAHMLDLSPCTVGQQVKKGDIVGLIGKTGGKDDSMASHLHFEIIKTKEGKDASNKLINTDIDYYHRPLIDEDTKNIYIRHFRIYSDSEKTNIIKEGGWYSTPKSYEIIDKNWYDPSLFIKNFTTPPPPSVPAGLTATAISTSQIYLLWNASSNNVGVAGYNVYRNGVYLKSVDTISTSDTGLDPLTEYCYTVTAYDAAGNESPQSSQFCLTTLDYDGVYGYVSFYYTPTGNSEQGPYCIGISPEGNTFTFTGDLAGSGSISGNQIQFDYMECGKQRTNTLIVTTTDGSSISGTYIASGGCLISQENGSWRAIKWGCPPQQVPEPSTMLLLVSGLISLAALRKKFRKK